MRRETLANPLQVLIFRQEEDGTCRLMEVIQSNGSAFEQVEYVQMDSAPGCELVVGRQRQRSGAAAVCRCTPFPAAAAEQLMMSGLLRIYYLRLELTTDAAS